MPFRIITGCYRTKKDIGLSMPFVNGMIYPEAESCGLLNHTLKIFLFSEREIHSMPSQIQEICTLKEYLKSIKDSPVSIKIFTNLTELPKYFPHSEIQFIQNKVVNNEIKQFILEMVSEVDADVVATHSKLVFDLFALDRDLNFAIADYEGTKRHAEIFVRGHEIPWSFFEPIWNCPWEAFYLLGDKFARETYTHYQSDFASLDLDKESSDIVRSLLINRIAQICYTRDKLLFYIQQRKYAARHKWKRQQFTFETTYYLSYYYFTLWGGIDQLSRIISNVLQLKLKDKKGKIGRSIGSERFVEKIMERSAELGNLYLQPEFKKWIEQLQRNRHFVAHEGCALLSPIVQEPEGGISDEEIEMEVERDPTLTHLRSIFGKEVTEPLKGLLRENLRLSKYKVMVDEVWIFQDKKTGHQYAFKPLLNIEWDFNNFKLILLQTIELLHKFIAGKKLSTIPDI